MKSSCPVLLAALLLLSCAERALDLGATPSASRDLAGPSTSTDLAGGVDLASGADLSTQLGVPCAGELCTMGEVCCPLSGRPAGCLPSGFGGMNDCPFGEQGYRCDGPEDCTVGERRCVADIARTPTTHATDTRCRRNQDSNQRVVCHQQADCQPGLVCVPIPVTPEGVLSLMVCDPLD